MSVQCDAFVREFSELLGEPSTLAIETPLDDLEEWDSLNVLMLITHVDEKYGVELPLQELSECESVADIFALLESSHNSTLSS